MAAMEEIFFGYDHENEIEGFQLFLSSGLNGIANILPIDRNENNNTLRSFAHEITGFIFVFRENYSTRVLKDYTLASQEARKRNQYIICVLVGEFSPRPDLSGSHVLIIHKNSEDRLPEKIAQYVINLLTDRNLSQDLFADTEKLQSLWMELKGLGDKADGFYALT